MCGVVAVGPLGNGVDVTRGQFAREEVRESCVVIKVVTPVIKPRARKANLSTTTTGHYTNKCTKCIK